MEKEKNTEEMTDKTEDIKETVQDTANENGENPEASAEQGTTGTEDELSEAEKLSNEVQEQKDKYLRLYSEFENFRRRTAKEKLDMVKTANENLILDLLPVIDDFERAEKSHGDEVSAEDLKKGFDLIKQKMVKALDKKGVKEIEVEQGSDFDPEFHEAITQIPAPEEKLKGKVVDVIEKGYLLGEKVIRFTKVVTGA